MGWFNAKKLGAFFFSSNNQVETDILKRQVFLGNQASLCLSSEFYREGLKTLLIARENGLIGAIRNPKNKEKYEEFSIRLDELNNIEVMLHNAVEKGVEAKVKLTVIQKEEKENIHA